MTDKFSFSREVDALRTIRDELKLKAHLAKADLKDELNKLETKWTRVEEELRRATSQAKDPVDAITKQTKELMADLKQGYEAVKKQIS